MIDISKYFSQSNSLSEDELFYLLELGIDPQTVDTDNLSSYALGGNVPLDSTLEGTPEDIVLPRNTPINPAVEGKQTFFKDGRMWVVFGDRAVPYDIAANNRGVDNPYNIFNAYQDKRYSSEYQQSLKPTPTRPTPPKVPLTSPPAVPGGDSSNYSSYGSFSQAFKAARKDLGKNKQFMFKGKPYSTNYKEEGVVRYDEGTVTVIDKSTGQEVTIARTVYDQNPSNYEPIVSRANSLANTFEIKGFNPGSMDSGTLDAPTQKTWDPKTGFKDVSWKELSPLVASLNNPYTRQADGTYVAQNNNTSYSNYLEDNKSEAQLRADDNLMNMFATATGDTAYGVEDALYKAGQSLAYKPNEKDFINPETGEVSETGMNMAKGFNALRGVSAAGKALMGGTRNVLEGFSTEKRNKLLMDEYYRKQAAALKNANTIYAEKGGTIPFLNDGGYLRYLEEGNEQQYSENGPQDPREQMPLQREMTGEYIQQQPQAAGIQPNAEFEGGEYVQHPDGQVQQVEGRKHSEGGERVALEEGTKIVSDKLKLGAKNAKILRDEFGISNIKATDTFASAVEKYTKKIGLKELNEGQQEYFNKLKKVEKVKNENSAELNNEFLSEKINDFEQKKAIIEPIRSRFTEFVYNLQQNSKKKVTEEEVKDSPSYMAFGGQIPKFEGGGEITFDQRKEYIKQLMEGMDVPLDAVGTDGKSVYQALVNQSKSTNLVNTEKLYSMMLKYSTNEALPKTYAEAKKNPVFWKNSFGNTNPFEVLKSGKNPSTTTDAETTNGATTIVDSSNAKTIKDIEKLNNSKGSNSLDPSEGKSKWEKEYENALAYRKHIGGTGDAFSDHLQYQKFLTENLNPQLKQLYKDDQILLNNKQRGMLSNMGVKGVDKILKWSDLDKETQSKLEDDFFISGYEDGLPGHRGIVLRQGDMTEDDYKAIDTSKRKYDKMTDDQGRPIYFEYNEDGSVKRDPNGQIIAYYPGGNQAPAENTTKAKEQVDATEGLNPFEGVKPKQYTRPVLPDMAIEPPNAMEAHMKAQHRYSTVDPVAVSYEDALTELYRQSDAAVDQFDGLTDTQRAAGIMGLTANTQDNAAKAIAAVNTQNAQTQFNTDQYNNTIYNKEEDQRVADALTYEQLQLTAKAKTDQDYADYMDKNREIRVMRHNYLTKDRQINSMIDNYHTDSLGNIVFDQNGVPIKNPYAGSSVAGTGLTSNGMYITETGERYEIGTDRKGQPIFKKVISTKELKKKP